MGGNDEKHINAAAIIADIFLFLGIRSSFAFFLSMLQSNTALFWSTCLTAVGIVRFPCNAFAFPLNSTEIKDTKGNEICQHSHPYSLLLYIKYTNIYICLWVFSVGK